MSQQGLRQASFRAIHGETGGSLNEDMLKAFAAEATIPAGATFNEAFMLWLQTRLSSSVQSLPSLMQSFAEQEGADNWSSLGSFDALSTEPPTFDALGTAILDQTTQTRTATITGVSGAFQLLVASKNLSGTTYNVPPHADYTPILSSPITNPSSANHGILLATRILPSAINDVTLLLDGSTDEWGMVVAQFLGASGIDVADTLAGSGDRSPVCPSVETTGPNRLIIHGYVGQGSTIALADENYPVGDTVIMTRQCAGAENLQHIGLSYVVQEAAGSTGTATFLNVTAANCTRVAFTIALKP